MIETLINFHQIYGTVDWGDKGHIKKALVFFSQLSKGKFKEFFIIFSIAVSVMKRAPFLKSSGTFWESRISFGRDQISRVYGM